MKKFSKLKTSLKGLLKTALGYLSILMEPFKELEPFKSISLKQIAMAFQGKSAKEIELYAIEKKLKKEETVRYQIRKEYEEKFNKGLVK